MKEIMIDLETLGTKTDSIIASIGACRFDIDTGQIGETFYCAMEWTSLFKEQNGKLGRKLDLDTLKWWMKQNDDARADLISGDTANLETGLGLLHDYVTEVPDSSVWGNGASFDISILENAYDQFPGYPIPWRFWKIRDVRTMVYLADKISYEWKAANHRQGTHHNALQDAIYQAQYVSDIWQQLKR